MTWAELQSVADSVPLGIEAIQRVAETHGLTCGYKRARTMARAAREAAGRAADPKRSATFLAGYDAKRSVTEARQSAASAEVSAPTRVLICSDLHVPYHHRPAVEAMIRRIGSWKPDHVVVNGDLLEGERIGVFTKPPDAPLLTDEVGAARAIIHRVRTAHPGASLHTTEGNHEARLGKLICNQAPGLYGLQELTWPNLLGLAADEWVPRGELLRLGPLAIYHGSIVRKWSAYTARGELQRIGPVAPVLLTGHTHRMGAHMHTDSAGLTQAWESGCLVDWRAQGWLHTQPDYQVGWIEAIYTDTTHHVWPRLWQGREAA